MIDRSRPDYYLFFTVLTLIAVGVVIVYSASAILALEKMGSTTFFAKRQTIWAIISLCLILVLTRVDYHRFEKL